MDALSLLKKDHRTVKGLFQKIDSARKGSERQKKLFKELARDLKAHDAIEAKIFYPALKENPKAREIVAEAHEEHHVIKLLLKEMEGLKVKDEAWQAKFQVLMENVLHHAEEEESEMFPKAKKAFEKEELEALGERMETLKEKVLAKL